MSEPSAAAPPSRGSGPDGDPDADREPSPLHLREAKLADLDALVALEHLCFPSNEAFARREYRRLLARGPYVSLLLEDDAGELVAFAGAVVHAGPKVGHVYTIHVHPAHRRRGHAQRVLEALHERLREQGCTQCVLEVRVDNDHAIRLYEDMGYRRFGRLERYYPGPEERDAWEYVLDL